MTNPLDTLALASRATMQKKNRLSVKNIGVGLTGLGAVNQRIPVDMPTKMLLLKAVKGSGAVKIETTGESLQGKEVKTGKAKTWNEKLDKLGGELEANKPSYFVLFRKPTDCLIITYVPDNAKPQRKMLYASNKESVKDALMELDPNMELEEYNVAEIEELTYKQYEKKAAIPRPYTEAEIRRQEHDNAETAGGYGLIARINAAGPGRPISTKGRPMSLKTGDENAKPMALPGLSGGFDPKSLRASLRPVGKSKGTGSPAPKGRFLERGKSSFSAVKDEHYDIVQKKFGVNDREKRVRKEIDTILAEGDQGLGEEDLPFALRKNKDSIVDDNILAPMNSETETEVAPTKVEEPAGSPAQPTRTKVKKPNIFVRVFGFLFGKKKPKPSSNIEDLV